MSNPAPRRLVDIDRDEVVSVVAIDGPGADDLAKEGIRPGSTVAVVARAPLGGTLVVRVGRARVAVPRAVAAGVIVKVQADEAGR